MISHNLEHACKTTGDGHEVGGGCMWNTQSPLCCQTIRKRTGGKEGGREDGESNKK